MKLRQSSSKGPAGSRTQYGDAPRSALGKPSDLERAHGARASRSAVLPRSSDAYRRSACFAAPQRVGESHGVVLPSWSRLQRPGTRRGLRADLMRRGCRQGSGCRACARALGRATASGRARTGRRATLPAPSIRAHSRSCPSSACDACQALDADQEEHHPSRTSARQAATEANDSAGPPS